MEWHDLRRINITKGFWGSLEGINKLFTWLSKSEAKGKRNMSYYQYLKQMNFLYFNDYSNDYYIVQIFS